MNRTTVIILFRISYIQLHRYTNNKIIMFNLYIRIYNLTLIIKEHTRQIKHTLHYTQYIYIYIYV